MLHFFFILYFERERMNSHESELHLTRRDQLNYNVFKIKIKLLLLCFKKFNITLLNTNLHYILLFKYSDKIYSIIFFLNYKFFDRAFSNSQLLIIIH